MNPFMPISEVVLSGGLNLFTKIVLIMNGLVGTVFIGRIALLAVQISPAQRYAEVLQSTVVYYATVSIYPHILSFIVNSCGTIAEKISFIPNENSQGVFSNFVDALFAGYPIIMMGGKIGFIFVQNLAFAVFTALISMFIAAGPIFIFLGTILDIHNGLKSYFGVLIALCLWPVLWNILGQLATTVGQQFDSAPVSSFCFWIVILILQVLSPLFTMSLLRGMSVNTGAGKAVQIITKIRKFK